MTRAQAQPSRLLLTQHQIVSFTGRERALDALAAWASGDEPVAALLVHGSRRPSPPAEDRDRRSAHNDFVPPGVNAVHDDGEHAERATARTSKQWVFGG